MRKSIYALIASVLALIIILSSIPAFASAITGDMNDDGNVDNKDVVILFRYVSNGKKAEDETVYDYNNSGEVDNKDVVSLFRFVSGNGKTNDGKTNNDQTQTVDGITVTKLPYTSKGLTINSITFTNSYKNTYASINVTNKSGKAISGLSSFPYKCCDKDGTVLKTGNVYLENLNNNESCTGDFYFPNNTVKILFDAANVHEGSARGEGETAEYNGITVTKLPYASKGIMINSITFTESYGNVIVSINVTNKSGKAIRNISSFSYKCYDKDKTVVKTSSVYLEELNNDESCNSNFYITDDIVKIIFDEAKVYEGEERKEGETEVRDGITVTKIPYTSKGLTVNSITFTKSYSSTVVMINVTNKTGKAISASSSFPYKCYDKDKTVVKSSEVYLEDLNNGESCSSEFYISDDVVKVVFGEAEVYEGEEHTEKETEIYDGITVTKLPYTSNGLTINSISFTKTYSSTEALINVTNVSEETISASSSFPYKCYDKDGTVVSTSDVYLENLNSGESCIGMLYIPDNTVKIIFDEANVYEGAAIEEGETKVYDDITVTKLPYTSNGVTINSITFTKTGGITASVNVTNISGKAIDGLSSFPYKCYDKDGYVLQTSSVYLEDMNNGESCSKEFYIPDSTTKILFGEAKIY